MLKTTISTGNLIKEQIVLMQSAHDEFETLSEEQKRIKKCPYTTVLGDKSNYFILGNCIIYLPRKKWIGEAYQVREILQINLPVVYPYSHI